jgi:transcriptional regulator with XRE-family HTH domain
MAGLTHSSVSGYELGTREPPLQVLLEYAKIANVYLEVLADDNLELPDKIPSLVKHEGVRRISAKKSRSK